MLYHLHDMSHALVAPWRVLADTARTLFSHPASPAAWTKTGRSISAGAELFERTTRRFAKPAFGLHKTRVNGHEIAVREEILLRTPFCHLLHFKRDTDIAQPRVLVVAPMSGHHATLLRGTVEALLPDFDVTITDWQDARNIPLSRGSFGMDDYIDTLIQFLHFLGENTHIIAVCQPSVQVMAATALMASGKDACRPASMTLMGGPIDTRRAPTAVTKLADEHSLKWFENTVISEVPAWYKGALRRVYPGFLQLSGFMSMNLDRHVTAHAELFDHLVQGDGESAKAHKKFYDEYLSVMDLPAEFYLDTIDKVFQQHALPKGTLTWRGLPVTPSDITETALLTIEGELDDISAPGQTYAAHDICTGLPASHKRHHLQPGCGHYGIFNGRKWREEIYPRVRDFIHTFNG